MIYVFDKGDHEWADFKLHAGAKLLRTFKTESVAELEKIIRTEDGRVKALAERALSEFKAPQIVEENQHRGLFGRFKWLFTGK